MCLILLAITSRQRHHHCVASVDADDDSIERALRDRRDEGLADENEHHTGVRLEPGYRERQQARRLEWKR